VNGERRTVFGKKVKRLRRLGRTPGVIAGPVVPEPIPVAVDEREFERAFHHVGTARLVDLVVDGTTYPVFIREVALHPVTREILNVEFYAPDLARPVTVTVPVVTVGELAPDVVGVVTIQTPELEIRALPDAVPEHIEVDLSLLSTERTVIHAGEIPLPVGVELETDPDVVVVVVDPRPRRRDRRPAALGGGGCRSGERAEVARERMNARARLRFAFVSGPRSGPPVPRSRSGARAAERRATSAPEANDAGAQPS
jgi:large subunit ribosomal protein L25